MSNSPEFQPSDQVLRRMPVITPSGMHKRVKKQRSVMLETMQHRPNNDEFAADKRFDAVLALFKAFGIINPGLAGDNAFEIAYRRKEFQVTQADPEEKRRLVGLAMDYAEPGQQYAPMVNIFLSTVVELTQQGRTHEVDEVALMTRTAVALLEEHTPRT